MTVTETSTRDRIVRVALEEIERNGIVGLRVADVAASAGVSVPLIYKYFRDRDGLLAEVLSETVSAVFMRDIKTLREMVDSSDGPIDAARLAELMPMPSEAARKRIRRLRVMAIAASYDIPRLADALAANQRMMNDATNDLVRAARERCGSQSPVSSIAVTVLMQALAFGLVTNDGFTETVVTDKEYRQLVTHLLELFVTK